MTNSIFRTKDFSKAKSIPCRERKFKILKQVTKKAI